MPAVGPRTSRDIVDNLDRIQGNILEGFNKDYQSFLFLRFTDAQRARTWLGSVVDEVASVAEVREFNRLFKKLVAWRKGELGILKATWMNLAFSFAGLQALKLTGADLDRFPDAFQQGMQACAAGIGDVGASDPQQWMAPFKNGGIHAVMIVASDSPKDLGEHVLRYLHNMGVSGGVQMVYLQQRAVRLDEPGHEHFGFKDGVSQPAVRHYDEHVPGVEAIQADPGQDRLHAGEFVLGYPTQLPTPKASGKDAKGNPVFLNPNPDEGPVSPAHALGNESAPDWAINGSYLVFRRLAQDVRGFRDFVAKQSVELFPDLAKSDPRTSYEVMGAKLVGRYPSGSPLEMTNNEEALVQAGTLRKNFDPAVGDPALRFPQILGDDPNSAPSQYVGNLPEDDRLDNNFEYGDDPDGTIVPRAAHIRKAYPRDSATPGGGESSTQGHRLMRRGIPFGTSFRTSLGATSHGGVPGVEEPGDRGLLFLCYQSSLERQFEFVQANWVNLETFPGNPTTPAPVNGQWFSDLDANDPDGQDPIIAQSTPAGQVKVPGAAKPHLMMQHFVTTTGGEYFFQPSIDSLRTVLAGLPAAVAPKAPAADGDVDQPGFDPCADAIADANKATGS
jgi:Dyp-type peroxidase family